MARRWTVAAVALLSLSCVLTLVVTATAQAPDTTLAVQQCVADLFTMTTRSGVEAAATLFDGCLSPNSSALVTSAALAGAVPSRDIATGTQLAVTDQLRHCGSMCSARRPTAWRTFFTMVNQSNTSVANFSITFSNCYCFNAAFEPSEANATFTRSPQQRLADENRMSTDPVRRLLGLIFNLNASLSSSPPGPLSDVWLVPQLGFEVCGTPAASILASQTTGAPPPIKNGGSTTTTSGNLLLSSSGGRHWLPVFSTELYCSPLDSDGGGCQIGCVRGAGCCHPPRASNDEDISDTAIVRYALTALGIFVGLECAVHFYYRHVRRAQSGEPIDGAAASAGDREERARQWRQRARRANDGLRSEEEAESLSAALMFGMQVMPAPKALNESGAAVTAADVCTICLDALGHTSVAVLPCAHVLHEACLRQFIAHNLRHFNDLLCPVCRHPILGSAQEEAPPHPILTAPNFTL